MGGVQFLGGSRNILVYILLFSIVQISCIQKGKESATNQVDTNPTEVGPLVVDDNIISFLKEFYTLYISENAKNHVNREYINGLKEKYVSKKLLDKLAKDQLDYDPFVNSQDYNIEWLQAIEITKYGQKDDTYLISLGNNETRTEILLLVKKLAGNYKIEGIESPDENANAKKLIFQEIVDLNGDGIKDKIELYANESLNDEYEKLHFRLPVKIFKGSKDGYQLWGQNKNLIFGPSNSCISEGYSRMVVKGNFFTIEQNICSNNLSIYSYTTFKVLDDQIVLHKYSEEYFDKSDHDRQIPTRVWTVNDFGKVHFQNLNEKDLIKIKQQTPK